MEPHRSLFVKGRMDPKIVDWTYERVKPRMCDLKESPTNAASARVVLRTPAQGGRLTPCHSPEGIQACSRAVV